MSFNYWPVTGGGTIPPGTEAVAVAPGVDPLPVDLPVVGNGNTKVKSGTKHGAGNDFATVTGATVAGHLATWDAAGNLIDGGAASGGAAVIAAAAFTGGGSALVAGTSPGVSLVYCVPVARACTLVAWSVTVDAGTAGFRVWRIAAGTAVPTVANVITTADLAISTGTNLRSTSFANFTGGVAPTFAVGDIIAIVLNAAATAKYAAFSLVAQ